MYFEEFSLLRTFVYVLGNPAANSGLLPLAPLKRFPSCGQSKRTAARIAVALVVCLVGLSRPANSAQTQLTVTTEHNDNARTGQNTQETILTTANVNSANFGKLFSVTVDGYVYAQPLYLSNVTIKGATHNVVYVATEADDVYAIDADNGAVLWYVTFINLSKGITTVDSVADLNCTDLTPQVGITSTPVIDTVNGTIFVVAKTKENGAFVQRLHALDVTTGAEKYNGPVVIQASVSGTGDGSSQGVINFDPLNEHNRPGLLLQNGHVLMAWASHCDTSPYHGWVMSYGSTSLSREAVWNSTPLGGLGGIWQGGGGVAGDANYNTFFATGNGDYDGASDYGDSVMKLGPPTTTFPILDWFTPYDQAYLSLADDDLGSAGVVLLPDQPAASAHQHLMVSCGKEGTIYLIDRDNMGHFSSNGNSDPQIVQSLVHVLPGCFGLPAWWNNNLYYAGTFNGDPAAGDYMRAFQFNPSTELLSTSSTSTTTAFFNYPGPVPSVSSNGTSNGIVWAVQTDAWATSGPAILHAYDATNLANEIYNSTQNAARDTAGPAVKYVAPTVVNGKVYVGTETELDVYGELSTLASVSLNPASVVGGSSTAGTVTLNGPAPANGITVTLSSANTAVATVPASVTVPSGSTTATFAVSTKSVSSVTPVVISGSVTGGAQAATLTVSPLLGSLTVNPAVVIGGTASTGTVTLNAPAPTGGSVVTLTSSAPGVAVVPASVTVASGATTASFVVGTNSVPTLSPVSISASLAGAIQSAPLNVTSALVSIAVTPANSSVLSGSTLQFTAVGTYADNSTQTLTSTVTWASTNPAAATINGSGLLNAVAGGSTTVQATYSSITGSTGLTVTTAGSGGLPSGLVGYWKFSEGSGTTAADSSGNGYTATLVNGITWTTGKVGGAISANGTNQYASVPTINLSGTSAVSVAMWFNHTYSTAGGHIMLESTPNYNLSTTGFGFFPDDNDCGGIQVAVSGNNGFSVNCFAQPSSGVWHHFVIIYDKTLGPTAETSLYIDGVMQTPTQNLNATANSNAFGNNPLYLFTRGGTKEYCAGTISGLQIYNRHLTAAEVQQIYTAGAATLVSIAVTPANPSITKGLTETFTATGTYSDNSTQNLTSSVTWSSSTTSVATMAGSVATAVGTGTSTIQATSGSISGSTVLTVTPATLVSIAVTPANSSMVVGATPVQYTATGTYSDSTTQNLTSSVTWSSLTTTIASITSGGLVTPVAKGSTTIQATSGSITGSTGLTVTTALVSIAVTPANPSIAKGRTQAFTATGTYSDNSTQNITSSVTWTSGTTTVATITSGGVATAAGTGTSTIQATSGSISGSTVLTVTAPTLVSIAVTPANSSMVVGATPVQYTATGTYSDNSTQNLTSSMTWTSTTTATATITSGGLVTPVAAGSTAIQATSGSIVGSTALTVTAASGITLSSVTLSPAAVTGGRSSSGTVTLSSAAPAGGLLVTLSSNNLAATAPANVTVASGSRTATFTVTTTPVAASTPVTITATIATGSKTTNLTINPPALSSVSVTPTSVRGGVSSTGTVKLSGAAPVGGTVVTLSDNNAAATVPTNVTVLAGATNATFAITTVPVATSVSVTISGLLATVTRTATLTVTHPVLSSVSLSPASVKGGTTSTGTVTLNGAAPTGGIVVTLADNSAAASTPASVMVPAGATSASFTVTTTTVSSSTAVTISAKYSGTTKTTTLTVTP